jgi:hypothetical protein
LYQLFFNDLPIFIRPVHSERAGAKDALEQLGTRNIQNIFMNHDGGCLLVEGTEDLWCYDLEGTLLWGCANINLIGIQKTAETQELERKKKQAAELAAPLAAQMAAQLAAQLATQ